VKRSPTALTAELLKKDGWLVWTVERVIPRINKRIDLWNCFDQLAIKDGEVIALQPTSWSNVPARVKKIAESEHIGEVRKLGWTLWVIGFRPTKDGKGYEHRIVDVS
jgi:hypothetical protein